MLYYPGHWILNLTCLNRYDAGIQTFDTANIYSNGQSEVILGKAIKKYNLPREEIVVLTKVCGVVGRTRREKYYPSPNPEEYGYVNQFGLSRKVCTPEPTVMHKLIEPLAYIRLREA